MTGGIIREMKVKDYSCCKMHLLPGSLLEFHEWDEVFNSEVTTLMLRAFTCEFCGQTYYLALE